MVQARHEVAVIGAGPAGSFAALRLAELGHDVLLMDSNPETRHPIICSGIVGREAFEEFDLPRSPILDSIGKARFFSPAGAQVAYEPPEPLAFVVDRTAFDRALTKRAAAVGVRVMRGCKAEGLLRDSSGITLSVRNGKLRTVRARAVVLATGSNRSLHADAGLGVPSAKTVAIGAEVPFTKLDSAEVFFGNGVAPGFFGWVVPSGPGMARLGVLSGFRARATFAGFLHKETVRSRLGTSSTREALEQARGRAVVQGVVCPSYADRVLVVGEAAGQVKTTTLGGIYFGLLGAEIAAEVLGRALETDRLDARRLAPYEKAWQKRLGGEIKAGLELQRLAVGMSDREIETLFEALNNGLSSAVRQVVRFDWHQPALKLIVKRIMKSKFGTSRAVS